MNLEWDRLKVFYYVAKERSISRAAERLRTFQPSVTRSIQQLEHQANSKLFIRNRKGLIFTKQGEMLFERVCNIMTEVELAQNEISGVAEEVSGHLTIAMTHAYASSVLIKHLCVFSKRYPDITLHLACDDLDLDLTKRDADVAVRPYDPRASELEQVFLHERRTQLFTSEKYIQKYGTPQKIEDLDNHNLIIFDPYHTAIQNTQNTNWVLTLGTMPGQKREPFMTMNSVECLAQVAEAGLGLIALSHDSSLIEKYNLIRILPDIEEYPVKMCYTYPLSLKNLATVNLLGSFLKKVFKNNTTPSYGQDQGR
jgi:DNA-binding transcriptional LysR family regulator